MKNTSHSEVIKTWTTNQVILATVFVVCVFLTFLLLYRLHEVIFLFFVAIVIGTAIRPAVDWLYYRGISRPVGIIGIYVLLGCFLLGFLALAVPLIAEQGTQFLQNVPQYYEDIRKGMLASGSHPLQNLGTRLPTRLGLFPVEEPTTEEMFNQVNQTFYYANLILKSILSIFAIFLLAFYWTQDSDLAIRTILRFIPPHRRNGIREFIYRAETKLGGYIRGQGILSVVVGIAAFIAYSLIGLPFTLVLAIIAGLMEIVPVFGPILGAIPALLVALSTDPEKAIWVLIATGLIQMMENAWLVPRIMNHSMGINPILIILCLVAFGSVLGFAGAVLAIPFAALIQLGIDQLVNSTDQPNGSERASERRAQNNHQEEPLPNLNEEEDWIEDFQTRSDFDTLFKGLADSERKRLKTVVQELAYIIKVWKTRSEKEHI